MKTPEIWQKFLKTRTANVMAIMSFIDIPIFLIFLSFLSGIHKVSELSGLLYIVLYTVLIPLFLLIKLLTIIITLLLDKFRKMPESNLIEIDKKSMTIETILIIINIFVSLSIIINILKVIFYPY
ncbi:TPA: hypothetical protein CPT80_06430 [Candidatus Gastranaerophilales bacterium HUM_9]|nr:MAG TPA: hypothetical protein CPT80_06430 [Candidatus Gastranaerophilales bacterium HUM_9]HBX34316.1 hypothetical protein [Cyanobacteria bacterium UBA11440]